MTQCNKRKADDISPPPRNDDKIFQEIRYGYTGATDSLGCFHQIGHQIGEETSKDPKIKGTRLKQNE